MALTVIAFTHLVFFLSLGPLTSPPFLVQGQVSPFLQQVFMPLVLAIFEVLGRPAEENDQTAALDKQMLRRSYFSFIQTITGSGMNEVMANQGEWSLQHNPKLLHVLILARNVLMMAQQFIHW